MASTQQRASSRILESFEKAIIKLEAKRKSRIFCFIEGNDEHICGPTLSDIYHKRKEFKNIKTLEILIHSHGGHADIAYQIATFFRRHCQTLGVIVPFEAKSAATLICLVADKIYMSEFAELGPIDVQVQDQLERGANPFSPLDEFKSLEFLRDYAVESLDYFTMLLLERSGMSIKEALHESIPCITAMMRPMYERVDPIKFGEHKRMLSEAEEYARRLLKLAKHSNPAEVAAKLVENYPAHSFVIDYHEASKELGLPVKKLEVGDFEMLQPIWDAINMDKGFYGFVKKRKPVRARARTARKRPTVISSVVAKATA